MKRDLKYYFIYLIGSFIPFFVIFSNFRIVTEPLPIYICISIIIFLVGLLTINKSLNKVNLLLFILLLIVSLIFYQGIAYAFIYFYNSIIRLYNLNNGINIAVINVYIDTSTIFYHILLFVSVIQYLISNILIQLQNKQKYGLIFLLSLILSLPILLVQIELNWYAWVLLVTYWFILFIFNTFKYAINQNQLLSLSIIIFIILSLTTTIFTKNFSEYKLKELYNPITIQQEVLDTFNEWLQKFSNIQFNDKEINLNNARNRIYTNAKHLEVQSSSKESLYLKYYSGAIYKSNTWTTLNEEDYEIAGNSVGKSFKWYNQFTFSDNDVETIMINDLREGRTFSIYPYNMRNIDQEYETYFDVFMKYPNKTATFQVWKHNESPENSQIDNRYFDFIHNNYLDVPDSIEHLFITKLGMFKKIMRINEATDKILSILADYSYTLSPGSTPEETDFIEYFLTENKKGYCVHFASAATLMFRFYGIPARYVEGYHVSSTMFDVNGVAEVIDRNAHAWVEVFDLNKGWQPIEVTVGQSIDEEDEVQRPNNPTRPNNQQDENNSQNPNNEQNNLQNNVILPPIEIGNESQFNIKEFMVEHIYLLILILFIIGYSIYRTVRLFVMKKRINQKDRKQAVIEIYEYLVKINRYKRIINNEMIQMFEKNKFSKDGLSEEEYLQLKEMISTISLETYKTLKMIQRIKFKFIDCLI